MLHRRAFCKALSTTPIFATPTSLRSAFADEVASIVIVSQHGLPYLPLMVMNTLKLVEKHAAKAGVYSLKPEYKTLGGTQSLIDALSPRPCAEWPLRIARGPPSVIAALAITSPNVWA